MRPFTRLVVGVTGAGPTRRMITGTKAGRSLAERFVAGETLESASAVALGLNQEGASVSLDYLGEEVNDPTSAEAAAGMYRRCIEEIVNQSIDGNISVKLTQLGLLLDAESAGHALYRLAANAAALGTTVTIDMEESRHTDATLDLYEKVQSESGNLGVCIQAALRRTREDLERLIPLGGHIRLCKGAYREAPEVAFQDKAEVDAAFAALLHRLMAADNVRPAVATHDSRLVDVAINLSTKRREPFEFQMLHGVRSPLRKTLVAAGHEVRVYVPFGEQWYPYLTRRLAERPANLGFFVKALFRSS